MRKGVFELDTRLGTLQGCAQCYRLIKTKGVNINSVENITGRPILEFLWEYPHECLFTILHAVQTMYLYNWMSDELFEKWMGLNTKGYQIGLNDKLLALWDERLTVVREANHKVDIVKTPSDLGNWDDGPAIKAMGYATRVCNVGKRHEHVEIRWSKVKSRRHVKDLNSIFPWSSDADKSHTSVDVASLIYWVTRQPGEVQGKLQERLKSALDCLPVGAANVTVSAWLMAAAGLDPVEKLFALVAKDKVCGMPSAVYAKYWKCVSTALRRTSRWPDGGHATLAEVTSCSYFELPTGRSVNISDWTEERKKRTECVVNLRPPLCEAEPNELSNGMYLQLLRVELDVIMRQLIRSSDIWPTWEVAVKTRQSWVSAGSSGGARIMVEGQNERLNKQAYFETISKEEMLTWLESEPAIRAVASEKFEMGKARAIYGTLPTDYAIMSYVIGSSERKLWRVDGVESGLSGLDEVMCVVRRAQVAATQGTECTMIDYADFNYQHTLPAQALVFSTMADRLREVRANPDVVRACDWCAKALLNQWCTYPNIAGPVRITQGMFSGCRGTNFLNTLLNVAYMRVASNEVKRHLNIEAVHFYNIHQGDDVWISNRSRLWAASLYLTLQKSGLIFQAGKQMFDRQRGEFLRVVYTKEGAQGYPVRAIGSLIISPVQSTEVHAAQDKAAALCSQIHLLYRRGVNKIACAWIWDAVVRHALSVTLPEGAGVAIPLRIAAANSAGGGLELGPPGRMGNFAVPVPIIPKLEAHTRVMEQAVARNMTGDWIEHISNIVQQSMNVEKVADGIHQANVSGSLRNKDKQAGLRGYEKQLKAWVAKLPRQAGSLWQPLAVHQLPGTMLSLTLQRKLDCIPQSSARKYGWEGRGAIDRVLAAIASGPFRDVNTVQQAMNMGIVEAAKYAIALCSSQRLRAEATAVVASVEMACSPEVLARILSGVGGVSRPWEAIFNPIILSWASKCAADLAIYDAAGRGIKTSMQWDAILLEKRDIVLKMLLEDGTMVKLSHF